MYGRIVMIFHLKIGCYDFHLLLQLVLLFFHEIQHMQKVGSDIVILLEREKVKVKTIQRNNTKEQYKKEYNKKMKKKGTTQKEPSRFFGLCT